MRVFSLNFFPEYICALALAAFVGFLSPAVSRADVASMHPLGFTLFDSNALTEDNVEEDDGEEWDSPREARRREPKEIGKIDIDLKRPESVVPGRVTEKAGLVIAILVFALGGTALAIFFGGRMNIAGSWPTARRGKSAKSRSGTKKTKTLTVPDVAAAQYYSVLGVTADASDEEIRSRYKHLIKSFHSDKLAGHDLPEEVLALTEQQFLKVQQAYEHIRSTRNMH